MRALVSPVLRFLKPNQRLWYWPYRQLDFAFRPFDDLRLQVVNHLKLNPPAIVLVDRVQSLNMLIVMASLLPLLVSI